MRHFKQALLSNFIVLVMFNLSYVSYSQSSLTDDELIKAVTTRPWKGESYPLLPSLSTKLKGGVLGELKNNSIRKAYEKLNANRGNIEWFEGIEELEKEKALWSLLSCLIHPHEDVQIYSLRSLEKLNDKRAVPFILIYAQYMAVLEGGSENATIHGAIHETIAKTMYSLTNVKVEINRQDPEKLKQGILLWYKWLVENEKSI